MENNRILVVEDEHIVALDIKMHLQNYGYVVPAMYATGEEALANFELIEPDQPLPPVDPALKGERDLGYMLYDIDFANGKTSHFFRARMQDGVIEVPPFQGAPA